MAVNKVFLCEKCANWYVEVPLPEGEVCLSCLTGKHAPHHRTGVIDCHVGHMTPTHSEVGIAKVALFIKEAVTGLQKRSATIARQTTAEAVANILRDAELAFASIEVEQHKVDNLLKWSGVFEMPGTQGLDNERRFKSIEVVEKLAKENRRPPEDVTVLRRSVRNCEAMASDLAPLVASASVALASVRQAAGAWKKPDFVTAGSATSGAASTFTDKPESTVAKVQCGCGGQYTYGRRHLHERSGVHKTWATENEKQLQPA